LVTLTPGAEAAWTIAAGEAASAGHPRIEPAHLLIGVLSLGKLGREADASAGVHAGRVRDENARLLQALSASGVDPMRLRRRARAQLGRGPLEGPPPGPLSRSLTCKAVFAAAEAVAGESGPVSAAHLLAALAEDVDLLTARVVRQGGGDVARLRSALLEAGRGAEPVPVAEGPVGRPPSEVASEPRGADVGPRLLTLEGFLREHVQGQEEALARVAGRLRQAFAALPGRRSGPAAVLLFLGPSGVGKRKTARLVADHLFGSGHGMIRIDASELTEESSVSKILGSPPGQLGPGAEGRLADAIRWKPRALLLLEEVDRAHPRVLDVFLHLFAEGRLADAKGRTVDGSGLLVVMTSNLTARGRHGVLGVDLLSRVDEIVAFRDLEPDDVERIVGRDLAEVTSTVERRHGIRVRVTSEAARFAAQQAALAAPGASGARRAVERLVQGPLSALVLTGKLTRHADWVVVFDEGGVYLLPEA
jgi:ATP-dependent Clp protease ATP-binding subunit ClpA